MSSSIYQTNPPHLFNSRECKIHGETAFVCLWLLFK